MAMQPPPLKQDDPFAGLAGLLQLKDTVGSALGGALSGAAQVPVLGGGLQALGTAGNVALTPLNLAVTLLGDERAKKAAADAYRTEGGDLPSIFDAPAVARAVDAGRQDFARRLGGIASDTNESVPNRLLAGAAGGVLDVAPLVAPVPLFPRGGGTLGERLISPKTEAAGTASGRFGVKKVGSGKFDHVVIDESGNTVSKPMTRAGAEGTANRMSREAAPAEAPAAPETVFGDSAPLSEVQTEGSAKAFGHKKIGQDWLGAMTDEIIQTGQTTMTPEFLVTDADIGPLIDASLRTGGQAITPESRLAAAQQIIANAMEKAPHKAAAVAKKSVDSVKRVAQTADGIAKRAAEGADPVQVFSDGIDAAAQIADEGQTLAPLRGGEQMTLLDRVVPEGERAADLKATPAAPKPTSALGQTLDALNGTRALVAGGDFSAAGRQLFPILFAHPKAYVQGVVKGAFNAFQNDVAFAATQKALKDYIATLGITADDAGLFLSEVGGGVLKGSDPYAGVGWIKQRFPFLSKYTDLLGRAEQGYVGSLNATRVAVLKGLVESAEAGGKKLTIPEIQAVAKDINLITGRFGHVGKDPMGQAAAAWKLANGLGFSPQFTASRAALLPETIKSAGKVIWDSAHGRKPTLADLEMVRLGAGYVASVTSMWALAKASGLNINPDPTSANFGKIELGKQGEVPAALVGAADFFGFSTQTYNGKVYLEPTNGVGPDVKLLAQVLGPFLGHPPTDQKGKQWNPWDPNFGERSVHDLVLNWTENKLNPALGTVVGATKGMPSDLGDVTENPVTSLLIPLWLQSAISASGTTAAGGPANVGPLSTLDAGSVEKRRLGRDLAVPPGMESLSGPRQVEASQFVQQNVKDRLNALVGTTEYQGASDAEKQTMIDRNTRSAADQARRDFAVRLVNQSDSVDEQVAAANVGLKAAGNRIDRAKTVLQMMQGGLSADAVRRIDASRDQTDPTKANYDPTVDEYLQGAQIADQWNRAPAFTLGTPEDWSAAQAAAKRLRALRADATRRGQSNLFADPNVVRFYTEAANGWLAILYGRDGSAKTNLIGPARREIQKDPLWRLFGPSIQENADI